MIPPKRKAIAQADVLLHRFHYALPGWDAAAERRLFTIKDKKKRSNNY
jgi:hypothetical protein